MSTERDTFPPPYPSFQVLHKSTIVHIASSQKDSGCPSVEVEVGIPATERDKGDRELETADCAVLSRRGFMFAQWKPCPDFPPQPCLSVNIAEGISNSLANCSICP
ncbi:hypothetical protein V8E54_000745 [Elaphomyces granulatus]